MRVKPRRELGSSKGFPVPVVVPAPVEGVEPSLCDSCQRARWDCERFDPNQVIVNCLQYRFWTRAAIREAQCYAAAGTDGSADWSRLCRLIDLEQRLGL